MDRWLRSLCNKYALSFEPVTQAKDFISTIIFNNSVFTFIDCITNLEPYLKAQPILIAAKTSQNDQPNPKGLDLYCLIFRMLRTASRLNMIIMDSRRMNLDWARMAVSEKKRKYYQMKHPELMEKVFSPKITSRPAKAPAHGESPSWQSIW